MNASTFDNVRDLVRFVVGRNTVIGNWDLAVHLANTTLTTPTLAHRLRKGAGNVPAEVSGFLNEVYERNLLRNTRLLSQLIEAVGCLNSIGVIPLLLKGSISLLSPVHDRGARLLTDLDFFVQPEELPKSLDALRSIGYQGHSLGATRASFPAVSYLPLVLSRPTDVGSIDIQCRVKGTRGPMDLSKIQAHTTQIRVGDSKAILPSPTLQLAYLLLHDLFQDGDYWRGLIDLRHVLDIERLTRGEIQWTFLQEVFSSPNSQRVIESQFRMIGALFGTRSTPIFVEDFLVVVQLRRKILQINYPWSRPLLTLLTVMLSWPPFFLPEGNSRTRFAELRRLFRSVSIGKL